MYHKMNHSFNSNNFAYKNDFINVIKRDPQVQKKLKDMLDNYIRLAYDYQSKIGYGTLIQIVTLKEMIILLSATMVDTDIEVKMKISRIKYLESKSLNFYFI